MLFLCTEWEWWEKGGSSVPVYSMARSGGTWTSHSLPSLPQTGKSLQPPRRRTHCGPLQVTSTELTKHIKIQSDMQGRLGETIGKLLFFSPTENEMKNVQWNVLLHCREYRIIGLNCIDYIRSLSYIMLKLNCLSLHSIHSMLFVEYEDFLFFFFLLRHNKATLLYTLIRFLQMNWHRKKVDYIKLHFRIQKKHIKRLNCEKAPLISFLWFSSDFTFSRAL